MIQLQKHLRLTR